MTSIYSQDTWIAQNYPQLAIDNYYMRLSGSSMATAHASGTAALMLSANVCQMCVTTFLTARLFWNLHGGGHLIRGVVPVYGPGVPLMALDNSSGPICLKENL